MILQNFPKNQEVKIKLGAEILLAKPKAKA